MERRDFIKISALSGVVATLEACHAPDKQLIRFVPEEDLVPGIATLKPSVCTLCSSGCGLQVRVMQGEAEVVRRGQQGLIKMGLAKKLEGNPQHPVNKGKLCARGQAGLQVLYHPDRITQPIKRSGPRGSAEFQPITWDEALHQLTTHLQTAQPASLTFLSLLLEGQRRVLIERFLQAYGAPPAVWYQPFDEAVLRQANLLSFGHSALPTFDLARADYVLCFGADFLGTWNSPVAQSIGYGEMRQGRPGRRAKLVQVESRMSQTGANHDEWIPCRPGMEGALALGIAHVILAGKHVAGKNVTGHAGSLIAGWSAGLPDYAPEAVEKQTGVPAETIKRLAREITQSGAAAAMIGGAPLAHTNGLFNALAVNALESLVDTASLLSFTPQPLPSAPASAANLTALVEHPPQTLLLYQANPVFSAPPAVRVREALAKIPTIVSFGSFLDETSIYADLILPDHAPLESWLDSTPESGSPQSVVNLAPPAVLPLHDTRSMPEVVLGVAHQLGGAVAKALPFNSYDAMLRAAYVPLRTRPGSIDAKTDDDFWDAMQTQGGWWSTGSVPHTADATSARHEPMARVLPQFAGDYPLHFLPYVSQSFGDGSLAHLPWLQELPDVLTSAMWSSWVEIHPQTAGQLGIQHGDLVEVTSQQGSVRAPAILSPGIAPDLVAMPVGQGHEHFGRFASGRGANPLAILAPLAEKETGSLAWAATRVKLTKVGGPEQARLVLYSGGMRGFPHEEERR